MPELLGILLIIIVGTILGFLGDAAFPGEILFSWLGAIVATIVGAFVGTIFFDLGPQIFGVDLIPALIGAIVFGVGFELLLTVVVGRR